MWISGRRRTQGGVRSHIPVLEFEYFSEVDIDDTEDFDVSMGRWKLNPLVYWTYDQVWNYIKTNKSILALFAHQNIKEKQKVSLRKRKPR